MSVGKMILIVTCDEQRLGCWERLFAGKGWDVIAVKTSDEARGVLTHRWVHVAVIDAQLENPQDLGDMSGIDLAVDTASVIPKLLWISAPLRAALDADAKSTSRRDETPGPFDRLNNALARVERGYRIIVGSVDESHGLKELSTQAERARSEHIRLNGALRMHPGIHGFIYQMAAEMDTLGMLAPMSVSDAASELEDVLRGMYYDLQDTREIKLVPQQEIWFENGTGILWVESHIPYEQGPFAIKVGMAKAVASENRRMKAHCSRLAARPSGWSQEACHLLHFGALQYTCVPSPTRVYGLGEYYRDAGREPRTVAEALERAFRFKGWWHPDCPRLHTADLDPANKDDARTLERCALTTPKGGICSLSTLCKRDLDLDGPERWSALDGCVSELLSQGKQMMGLLVRSAAHGDSFAVTINDCQIKPPGSKGFQLELPAPQRFVDKADQDGLFPTPSYVSFCSGIRRACQLLFHSDGQVWLADFGRAQWGPIWRDYAALECIVKFELAEVRYPAFWYNLETALLRPYRFDDSIRAPQIPARIDHEVEHGLVADMERARVVISRLRHLAHEATEQAVVDMKEYYSVLLFHTLHWIMQQDKWSDATVQSMRQRHALISAGMLCEKLNLWNEPQKWLAKIVEIEKPKDEEDGVTVH